MSQTAFKNWFLASRPKTLPAAVAPVMIGSAMAFGDGVHHIFSAFLCFFAALAIQVGTNIANDYYDHLKGADTADRIGPTRMTQAGLITPEAMKRGFIVAFAAAIVFGIPLVLRGGMPIVLIGGLAILSGFLYTAGPRPLGYIGLGEVFVFVFFGPIAVAGTYYVQSFEMNMAVILAGFAPGLLSVAILTVNNLRDIGSDARTGKRTLAVRFGRTFAQLEFLFAVLTACLIPVLIYFLIDDHKLILSCAAVALMAAPTIRTVLGASDGPLLNKALASTGKLLMIYSILFSIGWVL